MSGLWEKIWLQLEVSAGILVEYSSDLLSLLGVKFCSKILIGSSAEEWLWESELENGLFEDWLLLE